MGTPVGIGDPWVPIRALPLALEPDPPTKISMGWNELLLPMSLFDILKKRLDVFLEKNGISKKKKRQPERKKEKGHHLGELSWVFSDKSPLRLL